MIPETETDRLVHALKTPLTGVKLFSDILLSESGAIDVVTRDRYLAVISAEADRMSRMIANIVDCQNITSGRVEWCDDERDLVEAAALCARPFQRWCSAKGIGFSYVTGIESLVMVIDADRFMRLISGLLANALRFTERGGVRLELRSDGINLLLAVSDTGPGISEERLPQLFHQGGDEVNTSLVFARAVVDHYRGRIWAESVVGSGSTFRVELPLQRAGSVPGLR